MELGAAWYFILVVFSVLMIYLSVGVAGARNFASQSIKLPCPTLSPPTRIQVAQDDNNIFIKNQVLWEANILQKKLSDQEIINIKLNNFWTDDKRFPKYKKFSEDYKKIKIDLKIQEMLPKENILLELELSGWHGH